MKFVQSFLALSLVIGALGPVTYSLEEKKSSLNLETLIPGDELLRYFGASCETQGTWIQTARGQTESLISALKKIQDDKRCSSAGEVLAQLSIFSQRLVDLQEWSSGRRLYGDLSAQEQEILLQLSNTDASDTYTIDLLHDALRSVQIELATQLSRNESSKKYDQILESTVLADTVIAAEAVLNQALLNQECLLRQPTLLTTIASVTGMVGSAASLTNPALSLGLASGTEMLGTFIGYFRNHRVTKQIARANLANIGSAFQCVLESLSNQYCRTKDAIDLIDLKASNAQTVENDLEVAVRFLDREIPTFVQWLDKVRFGTLPNSKQDANRANEVLFEQTALQAIKRAGIGWIEQNRSYFDTAGSDQEGFYILKRIILGLAVPDRSSGQDYYSETLYSGSVEFIPYYLMGFTNASQVPKAFGNSLVGFSQFDPYSNEDHRVTIPMPTLDQVKSIFTYWVDDATEQVNRKLNLILQTDPGFVMAEAHDLTSNLSKLSPENALKRMIEFLKQNSNIASNHDGAFTQIYDDTIDILNNILVLLRSDEIDKRKLVEQVSHEAQLAFGVTFIQNRLELLVRRAIFEKYGQNRNQKNSLQILAANRFLEAFNSVRGNGNLAMMHSDMQKSLPLTIDTINAFSEVFSKNILKILDYYLQQEQSANKQKDRTLLKAYRHSRAELCYGLLAVPVWPENIPIDRCLGVNLEALIPGSPASPAISSQMIKGPHENRVCEHRDYFRISKIYQEWGHR
ncbi:MAG: hypothetical protein KDD48_06015 [Bdellovibrionales bacterium]|nr:hypothetical protein [Bdellovibrionales bacterium]